MTDEFDVRRTWDASWGSVCPFHGEVLQIELVDWDVEAGKVTMLMPYRSCFENSGIPEEAVIHGGVLASFVDTATAFSLCVSTKGRSTATINLQVDCLVPARRTDLTARARTVKCGHKIGLAEVEIFNEAGVLVATGRHTCYMR